MIDVVLKKFDLIDDSNINYFDSNNNNDYIEDKNED